MNGFLKRLCRSRRLQYKGAIVMDMTKTRLWKRLTAGMLVLVMTLVFSGVRGNAAEKKEAIYIKEFKLYIAPNSNKIESYDEAQEAAKAKEWFEKNGYTMIEGNLNADASGALKKDVGVYMGYSTTTDVKEAVTDLAVMNERGNYSESEYKKILEEQKKMYTDMVTDLKTMLEEYRKNVNNGVPTAIQAKEFMNGYVDDDTQQRLGDLLMTISDENLGTLLMQANGQVVLMINDRLSYACDNKNTTWLDRMAKLGSYDRLEKQALKACNNDITRANEVLDKKYKEDAKTLADRWEDVRQHITAIREKVKDWGLDSKSDEEVKTFFLENAENDEVKLFYNRYEILTALGAYKYEDKTLLDYFNQPADTFNGDGIRKLYPLAASLSAGQISAVDQTVSLFTLVMNALGAGAFNDLKNGETKKMLDKADAEEKKEAEETKEKLDTQLNTWKEQTPISIYEGVDREVFKDGVAGTSTAHEYSNGDGRTWADSLMGSTTAKRVAIGAAAGSILFAVGAAVTSRLLSPLVKDIGEVAFLWQNTVANGSRRQIGDVSIWFWGTSYSELSKKQKNALFDLAMQNYENGTNLNHLDVESILKYKFIKKFQIGFTVAATFLAVADIVATSITLYNYYNRDHLPIPACMVDLSYNEEKQTSFINYKSVRDNGKGCGDLNGGGGKQWLAIYQTKDTNAGNPILAPENGENFKIIVQYGSSVAPKTAGYSPLHLFGTPNTAQNLTYADGESGWSFNDGKNGTYVFFRRGTKDVVDEVVVEKSTEEVKKEDIEEKTKDDAKTEDETVKGAADDTKTDDTAVSGSAADIGTSMGTGMIVMIGALCGVVGIAIGFGVGTTRRKRKVTGGEDSGKE